MLTLMQRKSYILENESSSTEPSAKSASGSCAHIDSVHNNKSAVSLCLALSLGPICTLYQTRFFRVLPKFYYLISVAGEKNPSRMGIA